MLSNPRLVPDMTKFGKIFGRTEAQLKEKFRAEDLEKINELIALSESVSDKAETINQARILESIWTKVDACRYGNLEVIGDFSFEKLGQTIKIFSI